MVKVVDFIDLSFIKYGRSSWFYRLKFDEVLTSELISYVCIFSLSIGLVTLIWISFGH